MSQHRLPQAFGANEVGLDGGFEFLDGGQAALDFGNDRALFSKVWKSKGNLANYVLSDVAHGPLVVG